MKQAKVDIARCEDVAAQHRCNYPTCGPDQPLVYQGQFGPRGAKFARYECPACGTSWPERNLPDVKRLAFVREES